MDTLKDTSWDVLIAGTGLQQSLLALALSRSGKKILHIDTNDFYGGPDAAFSLQEAEQWVSRVNQEAQSQPFCNATFAKAEIEADVPEGPLKLSFSRAYTLALSTPLIYTQSKLLARLVSSKVYRQLEFQAVGNWWIYDQPETSPTEGNAPRGLFKPLPNGREDVFSDRSIDVRAKRNLMKFLKFVVEYEHHPEIWRAYADDPANQFLRDHFQLPETLQSLLLALTLCLESPSNVTVDHALPRIARHLTSVGVFGPGFAAVVPKWGGSSEIAQVACRACAVGGGTYVLGTGLKDIDIADRHIKLTLTNADQVVSRDVVTSESSRSEEQVARMISIVSSQLQGLFTSNVEGAPAAAVSVVVFPSGSLIVEGELQELPVYIMVHSAETGECPTGQSVLYATTMSRGSSKSRLDAAVSTLLTSFSSTLPLTADATQSRSDSAHAAKAQRLCTVFYEQSRGSQQVQTSSSVHKFPHPALDLAFDDRSLDAVEEVWRKIILETGSDSSTSDGGEEFLVFSDRTGMTDTDETDDD